MCPESHPCLPESRSCTSHLHKCASPARPGAGEHQTTRFLHVQTLHNHHQSVFRRPTKACPYPLQPVQVFHLLKCISDHTNMLSKKSLATCLLLLATVTSCLLASTPSSLRVCSSLELCFAHVRKRPRCSVLMSLLSHVCFAYLTHALSNNFIRRLRVCLQTNSPGWPDFQNNWKISKSWHWECPVP